MKDHELKTWPTFFWATVAGHKRFDYRLDDRGFEVGDTLWYREWDPQTEKFTGYNLRLLVRSVWKDIPGVPHDFCIMDTTIIQAPWQIIHDKETDEI